MSFDGGPWADAVLAARLLAADPRLGGAVVRAPAGPARDAWLAAYRAAAAGPVVRLPLGVDDDRLLGGLDLGATLGRGRAVVARGLLAEAAGGTLVVAMAERLAAGLAGRLAAALDGGGVRLILLDEGEGDEAVPPALAERCGLWLALPAGIGRGAADRGDGGSAPREDVNAGAPDATAGDAIYSGDVADPVATLCAITAAFGVGSARAGVFALRAARGAAALAGRAAVAEADVAAAARLVLGPRATRLPAGDADPDRHPRESEELSPNGPPEMGPRSRGDDEKDGDGDGHANADGDERPATAGDPAADRIVAATAAALPPGLFAALAAGRAPPGRGGGSGARRAGARGRPLPSRAGTPRGGQRLALVDTLRAAAPWQGLRRPPGETRVVVRRDDFRVARYAERAEATTIFAVDASGSAAAARLAEAKGAVELLLADAYVARTQVALIAFRGAVAEIVLPPTRSLARAKRALGDLAGGGGTPLAAGLAAAGALARVERGRGRTPFVVVLTDGRANIARDGTASRDRAAADALAAARTLAHDRVAAAFIDTAVRPGPAGAALAAALGARYAPLPAAGAAAMAGVVRALAPAP